MEMLTLKRKGFRNLSAAAFCWFMIGAGGHYVWVDPAHEAVVVARWLDPARSPGFVSRVARALAT